MDADTFSELASCVALLFLGPYIIAPPIAIAWVLIANAVKAVTGWQGMFPKHLRT